MGPYNASQDENISSLRILIVDQDQDQVEILKLLLELEGYVVKTAWDGSAGLKLAGEFNSNVIMISTTINDAGNSELAGAFLAALPEALLVAMIDWRQSEGDAGDFHFYLTKPVQLRHVSEILKTAFNDDAAPANEESGPEK